MASPLFTSSSFDFRCDCFRPHRLLNRAEIANIDVAELSRIQNMKLDVVKVLGLNRITYIGVDGQQRLFILKERIAGFSISDDFFHIVKLLTVGRDGSFESILFGT